MSSFKIDWSVLIPEIEDYLQLVRGGKARQHATFLDLQPRLADAVRRFCQQGHPARMLVVNGKADRRYLSLLASAISDHMPVVPGIEGVRYEISNGRATCRSATQLGDNFATTPGCLFEEWVGYAQLLGSLQLCQGEYQLQPGLVHQANGGFLILPLQALLVQPLLWWRLKQILFSGKFCWHSPDEKSPLPLPIPEMPLNFRLVLVADYLNLADFAELEPNWQLISSYAEIESEIHLDDISSKLAWMQYVNWLASVKNIPPLDEDAWPALLRSAIRYTEDQQRLPLCPIWLEGLLAEAALGAGNDFIKAEHIQAVLTARRWRESYLPEMAMHDIHHGQVRIETSGSAIGQLNGLSVVSYPGHSFSFGEPSRISCVVHLGDGDVADVERKADLGGNIHAKGMLIMQACLASELALEQQLPFSASVVFEQSYSEVDGDSASLAGLCTLVSALAQRALSQQIAVTGAVDQFGRVQAVGGINEKIEGFFSVCAKRGLTGGEGVIFPATNLGQLCLNDDVVEAVRRGDFNLWAVDNVADALPLLTGMAYKHDKEGQVESLLGLINERIMQLNIAQDRQRLPFLLRWLNLFNRS